jgi:glucose-6-phosphate 1-dehydrogenase
MSNHQSRNILIIFGASGDLTARKLIPAVYNLFKTHLLSDHGCVLGVGRTEFSDDEYRQKAILENKHLKSDDPASLKEFAKKVHYLSLETTDPDSYQQLKTRLESLDREHETNGNFIFYLSTPPSMYEVIAEGLSRVGLNQTEKSFRRLIIEKPFGYDLKSAIELNRKIHACFQEDQIYRIDHYLGKETVQNLLVTRFSNSIFEPLWNRNYIHHIEITAAESVGVEKRGGYYDHSGAMRDMVQNHLLNLVGLVAMEPPVELSADAIRNETLKVLKSLRPMTDEDIMNNVIRGQYIHSKARGNNYLGYREEEGVDKNSRTETYVAMKFYIDNWRWADIPFYIRTGKRLPARVTEIVVHFKSSPHYLFGDHKQNIDKDNLLVFRIQPDEGILLKFGMKIPGAGFNVKSVNMDFHYTDLADAYVPEAYERLLLDSMLGDATLYSRSDAVETAWQFIDPILNHWKNNPKMQIYGYPAGTWGPENADDLIEGLHLTWRYPSENLTDEGNYCVL